MKITKSYGPEITYSSLEYGDIFCYEDNFYIYTTIYQNEQSRCCVSVRLDTGDADKEFDEYTHVYLVNNCELVIK